MTPSRLHNYHDYIPATPDYPDTIAQNLETVSRSRDAISAALTSSRLAACFRMPNVHAN